MHRVINNMKPSSRQGGFTLLEALLTLFVLTVGILGVAGLQMQGMRSGGVAMQRTMVLMKSQELLDRMRANRDFITSYAGTGTGANGSCGDGATICIGAVLALHDLWLWRSDLNSTLPAITGTPIVIAPGLTPEQPATVTITVNWTDKTNTQGATTVPQTYSVQAQI
jgi:type IV pilus assembly protein PilV